MGNQEKSELRRRLRRARAQLSGDERAAAEREIGRLLKRRIKRGGRIGVYWPMGSELRLDGFVRADGVKQERKRGRAKLHVPQFAGRKIRVHGLSILLVPIVGIDREGYRLGQAGGYYDATLSAMKHRLQAKTIGVGFACQLVDRLPHEAHDVPLDGFVSERGALAFRRFRRPVRRRTS